MGKKAKVRSGTIFQPNQPDIAKLATALGPGQKGLDNGEGPL